MRRWFVFRGAKKLRKILRNAKGETAITLGCEIPREGRKRWLEIFFSLSGSGWGISRKGGDRLGEHNRSSYCHSRSFQSAGRPICSHRSCRSFPSFRPLGGNGPVSMALPTPSESLVVYYGPLMVIGFLGALIGFTAKAR